MTVANFLIAECKKYWQFILCQGILLGVRDTNIEFLGIKLISITDFRRDNLYPMHRSSITLV